MDEKPIIPKALKRYKGEIIFSFTWTDLAFLTIFGISIILVWTTSDLNYWLKFAFTFVLILVPLILTIPINDKKGYISIYRFIRYLTSQKKYKNISQLFPYKEIEEDGFIKLKSGSYILPIELTGFNIDILQDQEQQARINSFRSFIRSYDKKYSLIKCTLPNSLSEQEKVLNDKIKQFSQKNNKNEKYVKALKMNLNILGAIEERELNWVDKYFVMLYGTKKTINENKKKVMRHLQTAFLEPKEATPQMTNYLINSFYGKKPDEKIDDIDNISFFPNHINIDNKKFIRIYAIVGFPLYADIGWLECLNLGAQFSWNIKVENFNKEKATKKIDNVIKSLEVAQLSVKKASQETKKDTYLKGLHQLNHLLNANGEVISSTYTFIKIEANSLKDLDDASSELSSELNGRNISYSPLVNLQKEGFESVLPKPTLSTKKLTSLELPSVALAYGFPFTAEVLKDPDGIYLGYTNVGSNVYFDPFHRTAYRKNSNGIILGTSGAGKSTTSMKLIKDQVISNRKVIAIDPEREYKKLCEKLGGKWINFGSDKSSKGGEEVVINPLQFFKNESDDRELLSSHVQFLEQFFKTLFPDLGLIELNVLRETLLNLYISKGIDSKASSSKINPSKFPIISDLSKLISERRKKDRTSKKIILEKLELYFSVFEDPNSPEHNLWNGHTNFDVHVSDFIVMDTHTLSESGNERLSNSQLFLLLKLVNSLMIQNKVLKEQNKRKSRKMMIVIDEAHLLIDEKHPFGLNFMYQMVKRARKYDAMTLITTQNVRDFVGGNEDIRRKTSAIINTSQYAFLLGMNPGDIEDLDKVYKSIGGLTDLEKETLSTAEQGAGILAIGPKQRKIIQIDLSEEELELLEH